MHDKTLATYSKYIGDACHAQASQPYVCGGAIYLVSQPEMLQCTRSEIVIECLLTRSMYVKIYEHQYIYWQKHCL